MRYILGFLSVAYLSLTACSGSSTTTNTGAVQTAELDMLEQFEDYSGHLTSDGSKGSFISLRDDTLAHVYIYDNSATVKLTRFDDRLGLVPSEGRELLNALSPSATWVALSRLTLASGASQVIVGHFTGTSQAKIDLDANHSVNDLVFAQGSENYLAYVDRADTTRTTKVVKITGDATAVTLTEVGSFPGEERPLLAFVNGAIELSSITTNGVATQVVNARVYDENAQAWTTKSDGTVTIAAQDSLLPMSLSQAGLLSTATSYAGTSRKALGTAAAVNTDAAERVSILQGIQQNDFLAAALPYDFTNAAYLADQPPVIASLSSSLDGQYLVTAGTDYFACTVGSRQYPSIRMVRRSDMKVVTFTLAKPGSSILWTELVTNICGVIDGTYVPNVQYNLDVTVRKVDYVGQDGDYTNLLFISTATGDRELRLARFKLDWNSGTISDVTITEISAHPRS